MFPILVANQAGEFIMDNFIEYSTAINDCPYLVKLFDKKFIVMDRFTCRYIHFNKFNSLPIIFDEDYSKDVFGAINIHTKDVLENYVKTYGDEVFIVSVLTSLLDDLTKYCKVYLLISSSTSMCYGDDETDYLPKLIWKRKNYPIYEDNNNVIYCYYNMPKILFMYSVALSRPLYPFESKAVIDIYTSHDNIVHVPSHFPIINI